jgi:hypothetical protein
MYKRYRNDARIQPSEVKIPRRRFADGAAEWLTQLSEVLPVVVGQKPHPPVATSPEPALQTGR